MLRIAGTASISVRIPTAPDVYPVVAVMLLLLPAIVPPSEIGQSVETRGTGKLPSCEYGHVGESGIHLGKIESIRIGEDEGDSIVSCP
jgi:hypothetical protein